MDEGTRQRIEANLFHAARAAIADSDSFPWHRDRQGHCDTWKRYSSQALAIDLFGTLKTTSDPAQRLILDRFAAEIGLPTGGPWKVELEWRDEKNRLQEEPRARTQVDADRSQPSLRHFL